MADPHCVLSYEQVAFIEGKATMLQSPALQAIREDVLDLCATIRHLRDELGSRSSSPSAQTEASNG